MHAELIMGRLKTNKKNRGKGMILKASREKMLIIYKGSEILSGIGLTIWIKTF